MNIVICFVSCEEYLLFSVNKNIVCIVDRDDWNLVLVLLIKFIFFERLY